MNTLLAIVLGVHLSFRPPGMGKWRYLWRCLELRWFHPHRPLCDDEMGCVLTCKRLKKLYEYEARDAKDDFPKAKVL